MATDQACTVDEEDVQPEAVALLQTLQSLNEDVHCQGKAGLFLAAFLFFNCECINFSWSHTVFISVQSQHPVAIFCRFHSIWSKKFYYCRLCNGGEIRQRSVHVYLTMASAKLRQSSALCLTELPISHCECAVQCQLLFVAITAHFQFAIIVLFILVLQKMF